MPMITIEDNMLLCADIAEHYSNKDELVDAFLIKMEQDLIIENDMNRQDDIACLRSTVTTMVDSTMYLWGVVDKNGNVHSPFRLPDVIATSRKFAEIYAAGPMRRGDIKEWLMTEHWFKFYDSDDAISLLKRATFPFHYMISMFGGELEKFGEMSHDDVERSKDIAREMMKRVPAGNVEVATQ